MATTFARRGISVAKSVEELTEQKQAILARYVVRLRRVQDVGQACSPCRRGDLRRWTGPNRTPIPCLRTAPLWQGVGKKVADLLQVLRGDCAVVLEFAH